MAAAAGIEPAPPLDRSGFFRVVNTAV